MKDQFFADYLERLEGLQHRLHQAMHDLPVEASNWSPGPTMNPKMNTVAVLLAHITGVLKEGIDPALDNPPSRVRAQEFQTHGLLSAELLRRARPRLGPTPCLGTRLPAPRPCPSNLPNVAAKSAANPSKSLR